MSEPAASAAPAASRAMFPKARTAELMRGVLQVLADQPEPIPPREVIALLKQRIPPSEQELSLTDGGRERYTVNVQFWSVNSSKSGWLARSGGKWSITDAGRQALADFPNPDDLLDQSKVLYGEWQEASRSEAQSARREERLRRILLRLPVGRWASFTDVGELIDWAPAYLADWVWRNQPEGWAWLLRDDGSTSSGGAADDVHLAEQRALLDGDGLWFEGRAPADRRLSRRELSELLADDSPVRRAWLVRGSSVSGRNLVPVWLDDGFVSLPASTLPHLTPPVERSVVATAVERAFANRPIDYRRRKVDDYDRFLRQMQADDLVITSAEGQVYVGRVTSEAAWNDDPQMPARLRRAVSWELDAGVPFAELPAPLPERLSAPDDVVDLTADLTAIEGLIPEPVEADDDAAEPAPAPAPDLAAPDAELAASLHVPLDWLERVTRLLNRRRQLILFGPPGTGKTYLARELAKYWTEPANTTLVQFHPSVAYEDFIAGYRPVSHDGQVVFELRDGPLLRLAERARDNPSVPHVLIIDEINRANLAKVFGELYFLLEYRKAEIELLYSEAGNQFTLPANVFIVGTMNTADRSIALVDAAMRRRFPFVELHPDESPVNGVLRSWLAANGYDSEAAELLDALNSQIPYRDFAIGPSYFMKDWVHQDPEGLAEVWRSDLMPLLAEHHAGESLDLQARYGLATLRRRLARESADPNAEVDGAAVPDAAMPSADASEPVPVEESEDQP